MPAALLLMDFQAGIVERLGSPDVVAAARTALRATQVADACADGDAEVHRVLTEKVFPRQADVTTVAAWSGSRT